MGKYGNSYSGNSFEEWWKQHYGTDYDGTSTNITKNEKMTDEDVAIGRQLLNNYLNKKKVESDFDTSQNTLLQKYTAAKSNLNENKRLAQQNASITYDKLKKYLPQQLKAQGLAGLGVSESTLLQAYNTYNNTMGNISGQHSKDVSELERAYGEQSSLLESEKNDKLYSIDRDENGNLLVNGVLDKYAQMKAEEEEKVADEEKAIEEAQYEIEANNIEVMYQGMIGDDGKISEEDYEKLKAYADNKALNLGKDYGKLLKSVASGFESSSRGDAAQNVIKATTATEPTVDVKIYGAHNTANNQKGDNFEISIPNESGVSIPYKVEKGYDASDELNEKLSNSYVSSKGAQPSKGAVMIYGGRIYMYLENKNKKQDRWCVVQQRAISGKNDFERLCEKLGVSVYDRNYKDG